MNSYTKISLAVLLALSLGGHAFGQLSSDGEQKGSSPVHKTGSIVWKTDLAEALKLAQDQRKLVFLHFSGTHCPPCRKLEDNVLNRNDVAITMLSRYVPVYVIVEQSQNLVDRFHVQAWPTDIILDAQGREIARQVSPQNPQEFVKRLSTISAKHFAGQSATIANVRAAVAADVTETSAPVQHTAPEERPIAKAPRAESKIVHNPHTKDSRLPPIVVARNTKAKKRPPDEEGFSPPSERRKPPIVRKARETEEQPLVAQADPELIDEESVDADVAPWRKNARLKKALPQEDPLEPPQSTETEQEPVAESTEGEPSSDPAPDEPMQEQAENDTAESESVDPTVQESPKNVEPENPPAAANTTDELPTPRSRFGAAESAEEPVESSAPVNDAVEEAAKPSAEATAPEETGEPKVAPRAEATETPDDKPEATEQASAPDSGETPRPKSRFSDREVATEQPPAEEPESTNEEETDEATEAQEAEPPAEPEAQTKSAEDANAAKDNTEVAPPQETEAKQEPTDDEIGRPADEVEPAKPVAKPVAKPKKSADIDAGKKSKRPVASPPSKTPGSDESSVEEKSTTPRGLAKIARSGKYVLGGHCCVTLLEKEILKKGNPQFGAIHRGRIFLFASAEARKKFLENPDDYSPMLTGYDPVLFADEGELVDGSAEILAKLHDGRVVTFSSEETYQKFASDYKKSREKSLYVEAVRAAMKETNGGRHFR